MSAKGYIPDTFTLALIATVLVATFSPCRNEVAHIFDVITYIAIALLFFFHGAKLERSAIIAGFTHWRLHILVFAATFVMFPIVGILLQPILTNLITPELYLGVLFLCTLPSTVQSSIAFTSIARGNVPAAVCSASASSILGIFITPILVGLILNAGKNQNHSSALEGILDISKQLLLPFILGQISRYFIKSWIHRNKSILKIFDQGSILLVVYTAFSAAVIEGLWKQIPPQTLIGIIIVSIILLMIAMALTYFAARNLGFNKEDEITIVFCGSKKSLASGVPIANVLFPPHSVGLMVLPLMIFHQIQLMACAVLAKSYSKRCEKT